MLKSRSSLSDKTQVMFGRRYRCPHFLWLSRCLQYLLLWRCSSRFEMDQRVHWQRWHDTVCLPSSHSTAYCTYTYTTMLSFVTVALTAFSTSLFILSATASPCVVFDSNFNLYAFGLGGKDFALGTQDTWTSMSPLSLLFQGI
jgi:hypothetical protein